MKTVYGFGSTQTWAGVSVIIAAAALLVFAWRLSIPDDAQSLMRKADLYCTVDKLMADPQNMARCAEITRKFEALNRAAGR